MRLPCFVFVSALLCVSSARAEAADLEAKPKHFALGGSLGYFSTGQAASQVYVTTWRAGLLYALDERFAFSLDAGLVVLRSSPDRGAGDWAIRSGNPTAFGLMRGHWGDARYQFGVGAAAPLATVNRDSSGSLQHVALDYAASIDGLWDQWLWATNRSAAVLRAVFDLPVVDKSWLTFTFTPALYFPAWEAFGHEPVSVLLPVALSFGARHRVVWFGGRAQAVLMPQSNLDSAQVALGPWFRVILGSAFVEARVVVNIDEPLAGQRGPGIWGLHVGGGGEL